MFLDYGKSMWKVWARCPYCGKEVFYREMLGKAKSVEKLQSKKGSGFFRPIGWLFSKAIEALHNKRSRKVWALHIKRAFYYLISFRHSFFNSLNTFLAREAECQALPLAARTATRDLGYISPLMGLKMNLSFLR